MKATIRQVAELAGVSITTVSHVLNNKEGTRVRQETQRKVLEAAKKLNYHSSGGSRAQIIKRTGNLGLILPPDRTGRYLDLEVFSGVLGKLCGTVSEMGYSLLVELADIQPDGQCALPSFVKDGKVDGCMVMGLEAEAVDSLVNEIGRVIPFISIDREHSEIDCVVRDNFKGALLATNHLISKGCKSIICLCPSGPVYEPLHPAYSERIDGFVLGLARSGVTDPMSSVEMVYRSQLSEKLADLINSNKKIDGVLALSRSVGGAFTDMWSVLSKTPCPQVVSFDDCREAADVYNGPGQRVSVLVDSLSIAENAVKILVNRIQGSVVGNIRVVVKAELSVEPGEALNSVIA